MRQLQDQLQTRWNHLVTAYPIADFPQVAEWLTAKQLQYAKAGLKNADDFQAKAYCYWLNIYFTHEEVTSVDDINLLLAEDGKHRNTRFEQFMNDVRSRPELFKKGKVPSNKTLSTITMGVIRSFYKYHGSPITISTPSSPSSNYGDVTFTDVMLRDILRSLPSPKHRLIFKMLAMTGLRPSDVLHTIKQTRIEKYRDHYFVRNLCTKKRAIPVPFVFFPAELANDLMRYHNVKDLRDVKTSDLFNVTSKYADDVIGSAVVTASSKCGIDGRVHLTLLRRYFQARVNKVWDIRFTEMVIGHKITVYLFESWHNDIDGYYEEWKKAEHLLCFDSVSPSNEITKLEHEIAKMKSENAELKENLHAIQMRLFLLDRLDLNAKETTLKFDSRVEFV